MRAFLLRRLFVRLFVVVVVLLGAGCDTQEAQRDFAAEAFSAPSGFVRTDANGVVLDEDLDDWRTAPAFDGIVFVEPAFPNPPGADIVTIPLSVRAFGAVAGGLALVMLDPNRPQTFITLAEETGARDPGAYILQFSPTSLQRRGLVRVFLVDGRRELVSYGDIFVE